MPRESLRGTLRARLRAVRLRHRILASLAVLLLLTHGAALVADRVMDGRALDLLNAHRLGPAMAGAVEAAERALAEGKPAGTPLLPQSPDLTAVWLPSGPPALPPGWVREAVPDSPRPVLVAAEGALLPPRAVPATASSPGEALAAVAEDTAAQLHEARVQVRLADGS